MNAKNIVGKRVQKARRVAKPPITQTDVIARLQLSGIMMDQSTLSKIENQQRPVTDIEVVALAPASTTGGEFESAITGVAIGNMAKGSAIVMSNPSIKIGFLNLVFI